MIRFQLKHMPLEMPNVLTHVPLQKAAIAQKHQVSNFCPVSLSAKVRLDEAVVGYAVLDRTKPSTTAPSDPARLRLMQW